MHRVAALIAGLAVAAAACSSATPVDPARPGRLAILDAAGDIVVIDPDGGATVKVTSDGGTGAAYFQPTWSPDGASLVFSRASTRGAEVLVHDVDAGTSSRRDTPTPAFYFSWSADGEQIAYLANDALGRGLTLAVIDQDAIHVRNDTGQPYYFSWGADGSMAVHVGADRIAVVDDDGDDREWELGPPGLFRAPHWIGDAVLYLEDSATGNRMVVAGRNTEPRVVAEMTGGASFVASPAGDRVAIQAVDASKDGAFAVNGRTVAAQVASLLPANRLVVLDLDTLEWEPVGGGPVVAFSWSPGGDRLLVLTLHDRAAGELRWQAWSDAGLGDPVVFVPGPELVRDVLPFFDQYAQSLSFWSPDGTKYAFPGTVDGEPGIYVVDAETGAPTKVADGTWVAWSPG